MAGSGYKNFNTGDVLTAGDVDNYLMEQTVMVFADAAARTTALTSVLAEGMISYLKDTNSTEYYSGSAWVAIAGATGGMTSIASGSLSTGSGTLSLTSISGTYKNLQLVVRDWYPTTDGAGVVMTCNSVTSYDYASIFAVSDGGTIQSDTQIANANVGLHYNSVKNVDANNVFVLNLYDYANASSAKAFSSIIRYTNQSTSIGQVGITNGAINTASAITSISWGLSAGSGNFAQGTYVLYGVN
jgi:hypothetical protein